MGKNYYKILGVRQNASDQQIKEAYKSLAMKHHPDKNPDDRQKAKQRFTEIGEAYQILSNHEKREEYDRIRENESHSERSRKSRNQYTWKNPQFDPKYDHFQQMPQHIKNFGMKGFKDIQFPIFDTSNWFQEEFGSFTFEKAEHIFEKVFSKYDKEMQKLQIKHQNRREIEHNNSENQVQRIQENNSSIEDYKPKNSTLINEKVIQRNGKRICVKKFNIIQNGKSHIEVHQSVIGRV